jgi:hypothetical protein
MPACPWIWRGYDRVLFPPVRNDFLMGKPIPPSRAILKVAISMAMRAGDEEEVHRLKCLYLQLGKKFGGRRGNAVKEKFTLHQKKIRLANNSGTTRDKPTTCTTKPITLSGSMPPTLPPN